MLIADNSENIILECQGLTKSFGALAAVDNLDLSISDGEVVGIGGPNGAGKTTFFDLISGLSSVTKGEIRFLGKEITKLAPHQICHLGMARTFQLNSGFDQMSVYENILAARVFGPKGSGGWILTREADRNAAHELLLDLKLEDIASSKVADISVLARKKLMVATALINKPDILLLDEPVGGLTPKEIDEFIELVNAVKFSGVTLIFIEHVMRFLTTVASRAVMMHQGKIIYDGNPIEISSNKRVSEVYLGTSQQVGV